MNNFFENKFVKLLQSFGEKLTSNKYLLAITSGLMATMSLMLVGAIFQIIGSPPEITDAIQKNGGFLLVFLKSWTQFATKYNHIIMTPYNMTMGIISVVASFTIAYHLAKSFHMKPLVNGIVSLVIFLIVASPANTVILQDGSTTFSGLDTTALGGIGIFTAIIIAIVTVKVYKFCEDKKIIIKLPSAIPQFLADSFSSLIPLLINLIIFHGLNTLINIYLGTTMPLLIIGILSKPFEAISSFGGMIILCIFTMVLWTLGIQGTAVTFFAILPLYMQVILNNGALVAAGESPVYHPIILFNYFTMAGGTGNLLGLILLGLRSKSNQIRTVSKAAIFPSIFNISEPAVFGYPIIYNPILAIPFILDPIIMTILGHAGYLLGILKPPYVLLITPLPTGMNDFLTTMSWTNFAFAILAVLLSILIYLPFYKIYEKQLIAKEKADKISNKEEKITA